MIQTIGAAVSIAAMVLACVLFGIWYWNPKNIEPGPDDVGNAPTDGTEKDAEKPVSNKQ